MKLDCAVSSISNVRLRVQSDCCVIVCVLVESVLNRWLIAQDIALFPVTIPPAQPLWGPGGAVPQLLRLWQSRVQHLSENGAISVFNVSQGSAEALLKWDRENKACLLAFFVTFPQKISKSVHYYSVLFFLGVLPLISLTALPMPPNLLGGTIPSHVWEMLLSYVYSKAVVAPPPPE